jgi:hypothetical protein
MIGISFGLGASGDFRLLTIGFRDHWLPILNAQRDGTLNLASLSPQDQEQLLRRNMPLIVARQQHAGMGRIEPGDIVARRSGSPARNDGAMAESGIWGAARGIQCSGTGLED